ncbi:MAG: MFS transporter [Thermoleophilia bacterium]
MSTAQAERTAPGAPRRTGANLTLGLLAVVAVSYVLQQTLVVPALPSLQRDLNTTNTWATWVFTGFLLTSAISTPLLGKLGDTYGKKRLLVIAMVIFAAATVLCALSTSIAMLIVARALQGAGGAIFPLSFGIIRDELPPERVGVGLGLLSATFGVGGGAGLVLSGVILENLSWQWLFWIGAVPVTLALFLVVPLIPESPIRTPARLDIPGAVALSGALGALLVALSEGESWGWLSPAVLGLFAAAALLTAAWIAIELRVPEPMVDIGMMRAPAVLWTNVGAFLAGFAMFGTFLLVPNFVQMPNGLPAEAAALVDYGFAASVIVAGLYLLPSSLVMLLVGPAGGLAERRLGARRVCTTGLAVLAVGAVMLALLHSSGWQIVIAMALVGAGVGLAYAMLAKLIVDAVSPEVTGVAMGMNTVMRTIGGVVGGQVGAAVLSAVTIDGTPIPAEGAFTAVFLLSGIVALLAAAGIWRVPKPAPVRVVPASAPGA